MTSPTLPLLSPPSTSIAATSVFVLPAPTTHYPRCRRSVRPRPQMDERKRESPLVRARRFPWSATMTTTRATILMRRWSDRQRPNMTVSGHHAPPTVCMYSVAEHVKCRGCKEIPACHIPETYHLVRRRRKSSVQGRARLLQRTAET